MRHFFKNFQKYRFLLVELIKKDIKIKYRSSILGVLWTLLEPLLTMIVLTIVFSEMLGGGDPFFPVYILSARLLYTFYSNGSKVALKSIRSNAAMISKVYVPKYMYPLAAVLSNYVIFLISLIALVLVMAFMKVPITWYILEAIVPLIIVGLLTLGTGMLMSTLNVFFRDLEYLWGVALMLIMYTCAIFYKVDKITRFKWIFKINPLYSCIVNFRNAIFGEPLDMYHVFYSLGFSVVLLVVGTLLFWKKQDDFILYI